jgi:2-C-methyl-D-erythritol 4-phosphate cytidylyltransferase
MYNGKAVCAVIAAGGSGSRFASGLPKQFMTLLGKPIIAWSAELIQRNPYIDGAVMVMREEFIPQWEDIAERYGFGKFTAAVPGGGDRQTSVYAGILRAAESAGADAIIAVHDGARPLASQEALNEAIEAADRYGGAVVSVPARDTVKQAEGAFVSGTPERSSLYIAQTPQAFRLELLLRAHEAARAQCFTGSDDAVLVERIGGAVRLITGSYRNIKITHPEDLAIAEVLA